MTSTKPGETYRATLVPVLQQIQHEHGFLEPAALKKYSEDSGVPLYRLQAVASFFPHFYLTPPKKVTVRVCRDMSCHLAGSHAMLNDLRAALGPEFAVEGTSCVGRCDRAPAACISITGHHEEHYFLGRSTEEMKNFAAAATKSPHLEADLDANHVSIMGTSKLDIYPDALPAYDAVTKIVAARDASINAAAESLRASKGWGIERLDQFRLGATRQMRGDAVLPDEVVDAIRCWQTEKDWGKGPEMGGWAEQFFTEINDADLRGLGGAGIPATQKWKDVRDAIRNLRRRNERDQAFIVVNGDESEPGTFKDRQILLRHPHTVIEGVIIAGLLTEATQGFIYIRHEYEEQIEACREEIRRAESLGFCGENASVLGRSFPVSVFVSPGGYICGEQSALIEAMSDRRGEPRNMPPKLETNGLDDCPTLVSNVETYAWSPFIIVKSGKAYAAEGINDCKGRRIFSISGDLNRPGVYEVPMGLSLRELVEGEEYCQGVAKGRKLKAFAPSGPSGGFLPARLTAANGLPRNHKTNKTWLAIAGRRGFDPNSDSLDILDLELELNVFRALSPTAALGAGMCVYDDTRDMVGEAVNSLEFFRNETCGKCVPCRLGSQKLASLGAHVLAGRVSKTRWETEIVPLIEELGTTIGLASICGLGRSVPMPWQTVLRYFPEDIARHLTA